MEKALIADPTDQNEVVRGNALVILGLLVRTDVVSIALRIVKDRTLGVGIRHCAVLALVNAGTPRPVPELLAVLDRSDPLHLNLLDMIGALIDESQIRTVLPFILRENATLSATYYHFQKLKSRDAIIQTLRYFLEHPNELNIIRAESYIEPIIELLRQFF